MKRMGGLTIAVILFLLCPLLWVVSKGMNKEAFIRLLERPDILGAALQSLLLGLITAIGATLIGTFTAFALPGLPKSLKRVVHVGILFPMVLPEITLGLLFLVWFIEVGTPLGWGTLITSHIAFCLSYSTLIMKIRVEMLDPAIVEAARDLGASPWHILRHGYIAQLAPALAASLVNCFVLSLDDFLISFFVKGLDQNPLPVQIYSMMRIGIGAEIYALSTILFCISLASVLISSAWLRKDSKAAFAR